MSTSREYFIGEISGGSMVQMECTDTLPGFQIRAMVYMKDINSKFTPTILFNHSDIYRGMMDARVSSHDKDLMRNDLINEMCKRVDNISHFVLEMDNELDDNGKHKLYKLVDFNKTMGLNKMLVPYDIMENKDEYTKEREKREPN